MDNCDCDYRIMERMWSMIKVLMSPSANGKDYIQSILINKNGFNPIVSTTTRPMRQGEIEGREYYYVDKSKFVDMINNDELIEYRTYNTLLNGVPDTWYYGLTKQPFDSSKDYVVILDVQGCKDFIDYVGEDSVEVYYIYCPNNIRTQRAMQRGSFDLTEWNRRLLSDAEVFSVDNMKDINYKTVDNYNRNITDVIKEIIG